MPVDILKPPPLKKNDNVYKFRNHLSDLNNPIQIAVDLLGLMHHGSFFKPAAHSQSDNAGIIGDSASRDNAGIINLSGLQFSVDKKLILKTLFTHESFLFIC